MNHHQTKRIIGVDLGDRKHVISVLDARTNEIIDERSITNHRDSLRRLSKKHPDALIALEVGAHSPWISRFFNKLGHAVVVTFSFLLGASPPVPNLDGFAVLLPNHL